MPHRDDARAPVCRLRAISEALDDSICWVHKQKVSAVTPGGVGDVAGGTVTLFSRKPMGVDAVTNPAAIALGADQQSTDSNMSRVRSYPATLAASTTAAVKKSVLLAQDPHTSAVIGS
ncbi:MAG: hypothetical protein EOO77_08035 [Oxalobacteraceae bacterium]|nr:MAG: hypothetical protein EOO77_08035 [Oxalobacteraceae bacterium]